MSLSDKLIADICNGSFQTQQLPAKKIRLRKITKAAITRIYTEQIAPLYPSLNKTQIRAALVLTNNSMHECRLILDMKCKFVDLRHRYKRSKLRPKTTANNKWSDLRSSLDARTKILPINKKRREDVERCEGVRLIETNKNKCEDVVKSMVVTSSVLSASFSSMKSSASSVYDFNDCESCIESPMEWFGNKRKNENRRVLSNKKVGVIIMKSQNGYRACPL